MNVEQHDVLVDREEERRQGFGSLGSIIGLLVAAWGAALASAPLNDNSFFTHLATGRIILGEGRVPTRDPYTFTASDEAWTVQSWLASVAYAGAERLAATLGLRLLVLGVFVAAASVLWRLTRPAASLPVRFVLAALALFVATGLWTERPYMVGVVGIGLVWLALDGAIPWWTMVPLLWVWGNSHGSFLFAGGLVVAVLVGGALDRGRSDWRQVPRDEARVAGAVLVGTILVAAGPLGFRALTFPLTALRSSDVFGLVTEWQAPRFRLASELAFLGLVTLTLVLLARQRTTWRTIVPTAAFVAAALYAQRNIVMATVVLVAACAQTAPALGTLRSGDRPRGGRPIAVAVAVVFVLAVANTLLTPAGSVDDYAARPLAWLGEEPSQGRVVTDVLHGNLLEVLDGPTGSVFVDDRFDLLPQELFDDYLQLEGGGTRWSDVLDRYDADVVIWARGAPLATLLEDSAAWRVSFSDSTWLLAERRVAPAP